MKILQIIPGSGGSFYCGNCLRDSKYVEAIKQMDHEVTMIPMYLPLFDDEHDITDVPVFYGAISIYLKQMSPIFRKAPKWFDRFLNSKRMLKFAAKKAGSTRATGLEGMTISMLEGEKGKQHEELERMVSWIADHHKPDIIHISNALLNGIAPRLKKVLNVPIVCSLQDEDVWIDPMAANYQEQSWGLMEANSEYIDAYVGVSEYYSKLILQKMNIPSEKVHSLHIGVDPSDYVYDADKPHPLNIGYISRMCYENGVDIVVDAFAILKKLPGFEEVKLYLTGGSTGDDREILKKIRNTIQESGLSQEVVFEDDFEREGRTRFFSNVSFITVPVRNGEAFGLYLLEAMASGVPVIQPELGAFPEIINLSKGGETYSPNTPEQLAKTWAEILKQPDKIQDLAKKARAGVENHFDIFVQAERLIDIYKSLK